MERYTIQSMTEEIKKNGFKNISESDIENLEIFSSEYDFDKDFREIKESSDETSKNILKILRKYALEKI